VVLLPNKPTAETGNEAVNFGGRRASRGPGCLFGPVAGFVADVFMTADDSLDELELTILLPCLNEAETIEICVGKAMSYLASSGVRGEVLVADNGSTDGSQQLAAAKGARVVPVRERGYGSALRNGILAARGRYVVMGDADDSYDLSDLGLFVVKLREGYDVVMGNRFRGGIAPGAMPFLHRYLGNPVLSFLGRLFFDVKIGDFHCGLRAFNRERVQALNLHTTGMEFASEMLIAAAVRSYRICEVPTTLKKDGRSRPPHLRTWRDGWRHLSFLLLLSPRWLFIYPGFALMLFGASITAFLFQGPVQIGHGVSVSIHTFLVGAIAMLAGTQILSCGLIAQRFAVRYQLLPESKWSYQFLTFERGLIVAISVIGLGMAGFIWSLLTWASMDFGPIADPIVLRVLIISLIGVAIGVQLGFTAFLAGLMSIPIRRDQMLAARNQDLSDAPSR
jgi:glycosyltransferase involved in cell wall biosynthesis